MLPFTKRPGRGGEDGVFTKDDLDDLAATNEKPATAAPPGSKRAVAKPDDFGDDEVTNFIPSKSVSAIVHEARSNPATIPPPPASRRPPASVPPPPMSQRPGKFITHVSGADEDEDGRTVVRGAPKIVKKSGSPPSHPPASMSPAAVIKATLESARAAKRAHEGALMPPPPAELLEDMTDRLAPDDPRLALANRIAAAPPNSVPPPPQSQRPHMQGGSMQSPYTAPMGMTPMGVSELGATMLAGMGPGGPPSNRGPMTGPPPPMHVGHGYAPASPSGSIPPPPQSYRPPSSYAPASQSGGHAGVPAHFMVPNGPYSDGRMDPPGTSVTARHKVSGRPASAWAIALVAAGLFVGVGAVAVMQSNDSLMDTTASFVDPSRAAPAKAAAPAAPAPEPAPQAAPTTAVAPTVVVPAAANADPSSGGVIGASAPAAPPHVASAAPAAAPPAAPPAAEPKPEAKPVAVAANPAPVSPAAPKTTWIAPTPKAQAPVAAAPAPAPAPKPTTAPKVAANDDPPPEKPTKPVKGGKPGKSDATDEETKKALEALQKAQLESSFDK